MSSDNAQPIIKRPLHVIRYIIVAAILLTMIIMTGCENALSIGFLMQDGSSSKEFNNDEISIEFEVNAKESTVYVKLVNRTNSWIEFFWNEGALTSPRGAKYTVSYLNSFKKTEIQKQDPIITSHLNQWSGIVFTHIEYQLDKRVTIEGEQTNTVSIMFYPREQQRLKVGLIDKAKDPSINLVGNENIDEYYGFLGWMQLYRKGSIFKWNVEYKIEGNLKKQELALVLVRLDDK